MKAMATKKKKAELAIQYPEIRALVLNYIREVTCSGFDKTNPINLFNGSYSGILNQVSGKEVFEWMKNEIHLYNVEGAIALINALLDRIPLN